MSALVQKTYQRYFEKKASGQSSSKWFQWDEESGYSYRVQNESGYSRKLAALYTANYTEGFSEVRGALARSNVHVVVRQRLPVAQKDVLEVEEETNSLEVLFCELASQWKESTKFTSSAREIILHPAYQRIIGLGPNVIPLVLMDLKENGGHWFWALQALTGDNPVGPEDAGRIKKMTQLWLEWGKKNSLFEAGCKR